VERNELRHEVLDRISELGGEDAYPVVPLDLFFNGNNDAASFAPNLEPHPGMDRIYSVLRSIAQRDNVSDVVMQIAEVLPDPEWPYASSVYVITSASAEEVNEWAASIEPDEVSPEDADNYGWLAYGDRERSTPPPGAPKIPAGYRSVILHWD
jgi:hypothetical protein